MTSSPQIVLIAGASGKAGQSIAFALAKQPERFLIKALVRFSSIDTPSTLKLKEKGIEIIPSDISEDDQQTLEEYLKGVDVVISTIAPPFQPEYQDKLFLAAKNAGVKRAIPSDFGPTAPPGAMAHHDQKVRVHEFIKGLGIPYTFILSGIWVNAAFPPPHSAKGVDSQKVFMGSGQQKNLYIDLDRVGEFLARILVDDRTINQTVQIYDGEATLDEIWEVASEVTGENFDDYSKLTPEIIEAQITANKGTYFQAVFEYIRNCFVNEENTLQKSIERGSLDGQKLYPDWVSRPLIESAKRYYTTQGINV